jgi:hypothetical protein
VVGPRWHDRSCNGTYYISVQGFSDSDYRILASIDDGQPVTLLNGIPITGIVPANEPDYLRMYQFFVPPDATHLEKLRVSVTPRYGTAEVYVSTDGQVATRAHYSVSNVDNGFYATSVDVPTCFDCIVSIAVGSQNNDAVAYVLLVFEREVREFNTFYFLMFFFNCVSLKSRGYPKEFYTNTLEHLQQILYFRRDIIL